MSPLLPATLLRATAITSIAALAFIAQAAPPEQPNQKTDRPRRSDVQPRPAAAAPSAGIVLPDNSVRQRVARSLLGDAPVVVASASQAGETPDSDKDKAPAPKPAATIHMPGVQTTHIAGGIAVPLNTNGPAEVAMSDGTLSAPVAEDIGTEDETAYNYDTYLYGWGTVFAQDGGHRHRAWSVCRVDRPARPVVQPVSSPYGSAKSGPEIHREAELTFSAAAAPRLLEFEAGNRSAQLEFHRATLTPGVQRAADGLRHEVTTPPMRARPPGPRPAPHR